MAVNHKKEFRKAAILFLREIGLVVHEVESANGFIPHIEIHDGEIYCDPDAEASALIHEAGHLACLTGDARSHCGCDVGSTQRMMYEHYMALDHDHPALRVAMQSGDPEATAWAWAAGKHLGIPDEFIIQNHEYDGEGEQIRLCLQLNAYLGINGLRATGICHTRAGGYPNMNYWLQPDFGLIPAANGTTQVATSTPTL